MEHVVPILEQVVALIGHLAWPAIALFVLYIVSRAIDPEIVKALLGSITSLKFGPSGVEVNRQVEAIASKMDSLDVRYYQLKSLVYEAVRQELGQGVTGEGMTVGNTGANAGEGEGAIPQALRKLAQDYAAVDDPSWKRRVAMKDELANKLGNYINTHRISRDALAEEGDKGLVIGLASAIHSSPEVGDAERLLKVAGKPKWLHVKYRILLAMASLVQRRLLDLDHVRAARAVLDGYENDTERPPDAALKRRITATRRMLEQYIQELS